MQDFNKENITQGIIQYLQDPNTDYAVLLNGQWGTGKTYFVKNELKNSIREYQCKDFDKEVQEKVIPLIYIPLNPPYRIYPQVVVRHSPERKKQILQDYRSRQNSYQKKVSKIVYVSLYGITSIEELELKIISKLIGESSIPIVNFMVNRYGSHLNWLTDLGFSFVTKETKVSNLIPFKQQFINLFLSGNKFDNLFLILDDLERSSIKFDEILGFVNNIVEHYDNNKILFIADQDKIKNEDKDEYNKFKEKTIRYTWQYNPNIKTVIENFLNKYKDNEKLFHAFSDNKNLLVSLIESSDHINLRTVNFCIQIISECFNIILNRDDLLNLEFSFVSRKERLNEQVCNRTLLELLIKFIVAVSFEIKSDGQHSFLKKWIEKPQDYYNDSFDFDAERREKFRVINILIKDNDTDKNEEFEMKNKALNELNERLEIRNFQSRFYLEEQEKLIPIITFPSVFDFVQNNYLDKPRFLKEVEEKRQELINKRSLFLKYPLILNDQTFLDFKEKILNEIAKDDISICISNIHIISSKLIEYSSKRYITESLEDIEKIIIDWINRIDIDRTPTLTHDEYLNVTQIHNESSSNDQLKRIAKKILDKNKHIKNYHLKNKLSEVLEDNHEINLGEKLKQLRDTVKELTEDRYQQNQSHDQGYPIHNFMNPQTAMRLLKQLEQGQYILDFFDILENIFIGDNDIEVMIKDSSAVEKWQASNPNNFLWLKEFSSLVENHLNLDNSPRPSWAIMKDRLDRISKLKN